MNRELSEVTKVNAILNMSGYGDLAVDLPVCQDGKYFDSKEGYLMIGRDWVALVMMARIRMARARITTRYAKLFEEAGLTYVIEDYCVMLEGVKFVFNNDANDVPELEGFVHDAAGKVIALTGNSDNAFARCAQMLLESAVECLDGTKSGDVTAPTSSALLNELAD